MLAQRTAITVRSIYNPTSGQLLQYGINQDLIGVLDFPKNRFQTIKLPFSVGHVTPFGDRWLLLDHVQSSPASYILTASDEQRANVSLVEQPLDTIGLANSGGHLDDQSLWFSSSTDYLARIDSTTDDGLLVERMKRKKPISSGDVPLQETYEKRRLQAFNLKDQSLLASFYSKNEIEKKFM